MEPDSSTPSRQGSGTKTDKTNKSIAQDDIPADHRPLSGVKEGITEGALPPGSTEPRVSPANEGRRNVNRGLHS